MIRVPEPDPPEVRSRPTWPTPLGRCRAMLAEVRAVTCGPPFSRSGWSQKTIDTDAHSS